MSRAEDIAARLLGRIGAVEKALTFCAFLVLTAVTFGDVVSREVTGTGLQWARQAGVYANLFVVMIGIGLASAGGTHLRPRFADRWLPRRWDPVLVRLQEALMAIFCLGFAAVSVYVVAESWVLQERSAVLRTLVWPVQSIMPLVFAIASLRHGAYAAWPALRPDEPAAAAFVGAGQNRAARK